ISRTCGADGGVDRGTRSELGPLDQQTVEDVVRTGAGYFYAEIVREGGMKPGKGQAMHEHVIGPIEHEPKQSGLVAGGLVPGVVVAVVGAVVAQDFVISRRAAGRGRNGKRTLGRMIARLETDGTVRPI